MKTKKDEPSSDFSKDDVLHLVKEIKRYFIDTASQASDPKFLEAVTIGMLDRTIGRIERGE